VFSHVVKTLTKEKTMNKKIEAQKDKARYLDNLKNSIANWNYACQEAEEHEVQDGETSLLAYDAREDAKEEVDYDFAILVAHCIRNGLSLDDVYEWTSIAVHIHMTEKSKKNKLKDADAEAA
jgi:hypothetical protein